MRHRHLDGERLAAAAIGSILERGGASDVLALLAELKRDPMGETAAAALRAAAASDVYGYPEPIRACLETWRAPAATPCSAGVHDGRRCSLPGR
jgi:hypothetical protein